MRDVRSESLLGRRVVTTRPERGELEEMLERYGATVVHLPLSEIFDLPLPVTVGSSFDWLVVTSANGAKRSQPWVDRSAKLCAVGSTTASTLSEIAKREVDLVPEHASGEDLVRSFPAAPVNGGSVVIVRGEQASDDVRVGIEQLGWVVTDVVAYRTVKRAVPPTTVSDAASAEVVVLAASSAADAWASLCATDDLVSPPVIAIGAPTAKTASSRGLHVAGTANPSTVDGLVRATVEYFN
jgi:uroporphyrinogen-III synthase